MEKYIEQQEFRERCWFIYGFWLGSIAIGWLKYNSIGENQSVEFDWKKCLSKFIIGWFHTHSNQLELVPSEEDKKTMRSWVRSLNKPLICGIMYDNKKKCCYLFKRWPEYNKILYEQKNAILIKNFFYLD